MIHRHSSLVCVLLVALLAVAKTAKADRLNILVIVAKMKQDNDAVVGK